MRSKASLKQGLRDRAKRMFQENMFSDDESDSAWEDIVDDYGDCRQPQQGRKSFLGELFGSQVKTNPEIIEARKIKQRMMKLELSEEGLIEHMRNEKKFNGPQKLHFGGRTVHGRESWYSALANQRGDWTDWETIVSEAS